jgi:SAM-dependent methyltransferase
LCEREDARVVWSCTASEAAQQWAVAEHEPERHAELTSVISDLWNGEVAANRECNACGFGFADPFVAGDHRFYSLAFGESGYPKDKWEFQQTLETLSQFDIKAWEVLEIGAGGGFFLDKLAGAGIPPRQCFGTEYNDASVAKMRGKGFDIRTLEVGQIASIGKGFDAVFMFQVLEHRDRLGLVFDSIHSVMKERGHLFIAVPNSARIRFNEANGSLLDTPPNHISRWTPENFRLAAEKFGFRLVSTAIQPFDAAHFMKQDLLFSFMRRAQMPGTIANYLYPRRKHPVARAAAAAAIGANALSRVPIWLRKRAEIAQLGANIWAHLERL